MRFVEMKAKYRSNSSLFTLLFIYRFSSPNFFSSVLLLLLKIIHTNTFVV